MLRRSGSRWCWPPTRSTTRAPRPRRGAVEPRPGRALPVSALHGRGTATCSTPYSPRSRGARARPPTRRGPRRVALIGQPNVGKSSACSTSWPAGAGRRRQRRRHHLRPGRRARRPRRPETWRFVDTAGIRRRVHQARGAEFYASLRTPTAHRRSRGRRRPHRRPESISEQDVRVSSSIDAGRALVIAFNKWDLLDEERRHYLEREIERELVQIPWAPRVNISARTGRHVDQLVPALDTALEGWETRISHRALNALPRRSWSPRPHPVRGGKQPRSSCSGPSHSRPAPVRALHLGLHRGRLRALHRASPARGVRLRRHADRARQRVRERRSR